MSTDFSIFLSYFVSFITDTVTLCYDIYEVIRVDISERIKFYRKEKGLTQMNLGKLVHKSSQVISNWERGYTTTINQDDIINLSQALGVSIDKLVDTKYSLLNDTTTSSTDIHSKKDTQDLAKFLEKTEVMFDGDTYHLDEEGKQKLRNALEFVFWDAKRQNKRKKD